MKAAAKNKNDEFYTQYVDIEKCVGELKSQLRGKNIYCPCDDPRWSNFWKYFHEHFAEIGLNKLVASFKPLEGSESFVMSYYGGNDADTYVGSVKPLIGDGDFRNIEMEPFFAECDIVITNPPFSLFRAFVERIFMHNKDFVLIGNHNACSYNSIFGYCRDGYIKPFCCNADGLKFKNGDKITKISAAWFTTLSVNEPPPMKLSNKSISDFKLIDDTDIINIDCYRDIPDNYFGPIAVPVTVIYKLNSSQFKLIDMIKNPKVGGKNIFTRFVIRRVV